jgi:predicted HicB family RNase H-like nuclease
MSNNLPVILVRVEPALRKQILERAKLEKRSLSNLVALILAREFEKKK